MDEALKLLHNLPTWVQVVSVLMMVVLVGVGVPVGRYFNEKRKSVADARKVNAEAAKIQAEADAIDMDAHIKTVEKYKEWFDDVSGQVDKMRDINRQMNVELEKVKEENEKLAKVVDDTSKTNKQLHAMFEDTKASFIECMKRLREHDIPTMELHDLHLKS